MKGCRPLTKQEITQCFQTFDGLYEKRNRLFFLLGIFTGFRVSELLSIKVKDIYKFDKVVDDLSIKRRFMKGGRSAKRINGRTVHLNDKIKPIIKNYILNWDNIYKRPLSPEGNDYLFNSQKVNENGTGKAVSSRHMIYILKDIFEKNKLTGNLSSHTLRKTYAANMHEALGNDILKTKEALGHKDVSSTQNYLSFDLKEINEAIEKLNFI